jgi:septum site-determining protein MinC
MQPEAAPQQKLRLRGRSYVAFIFAPVAPVMDWLAEIDAMLVGSPGFFANRPVVLDLAALDLSPQGIRQLIDSLQERGIRVLGIEGVDPSRLDARLPPLLTGGRNQALQVVEAPKAELPALASAAPLVLQTPVRSGQCIYAEGDVIVLGAVGSGAEVVAGGSIHVYGALRGRAMAGINGNAAARIFCQKIEAELLAIDGFYQTADEIEAMLRGRPAQAWLDGESMKITPLN